MIRAIQSNLNVPLAQQQQAPASSKIALVAAAVLATFAASVLLPWQIALPLGACFLGISILVCCDRPDDVILVDRTAEPHIHAPAPPIIVEQRMPPDIVVVPGAPAPYPIIVESYPSYRYPTHVYGPRVPVGTGAYTPPLRAQPPRPVYNPGYSPSAPRAPVGTGAHTPPMHHRAPPPRTTYAPSAPRAPVGGFGNRGFSAPPRTQHSTPQTRSFPTNANRAPVGRR